MCHRSSFFPWGSLADTELDHQIYAWQQMGVEIHICHTQPLDANCFKMKLQERGCVLHEPMEWESVEGMHVISYCNSDFLKNVHEIHKYARSTSFVNCMTWNFPKEIAAHREGLIDFHLYQTNHGLDMVSRKLKEYSVPYRPLMVRPYFHSDYFQFHMNRDNSEFRFGRISRGDADKFNKYQLMIYESMVSPIPKHGMILGWDLRAQKKLNRVPTKFIRVYPESQISQQDFYSFCDVIILTTDTFENLPRVGFEAMASGSVLLVDKRGGWKLQVENGKTGFLCTHPDEFIYKASRLAFEPQERQDMRLAAKTKLEKEWGLASSIQSWEHVFKEWQKFR